MVLMKKPEGKRQLGRYSIDVRTTLKWILKEKGGRPLTGFYWLRTGTIFGCC